MSHLRHAAYPIGGDKCARRLLLEWRETPDGWQGRVVRPELDIEDECWRPREEWLPAAQLEQA